MLHPYRSAMSTVTTIILIALVAAAAMSLRRISRMRAYRERGEPLPSYLAGSLFADVSTMLLVVSIIVSNEALKWGLLVAAIGCMVAETVQARRAAKVR